MPKKYLLIATLVGIVKLFLICALMSGSARGAMYYVSTQGSDANDGLSERSAWRTISHAAKVAKAGDVVKIAAGSYEGERVVIANSGAESAPIVFEGFNGTPTLDGRDGTGRGILVSGKEHIVLKNLKLIRYGIGVRIQRAKHIVLDAVVCHDMGTVKRGAGFSISARSSHITLRNCETKNCAMHGLNIMSESNNILVENCTFYVTCGERLCSDYGIYTEHAHHVTIKRCVIRNLNPRPRGKAYGGGHGIALRFGSHHNRVVACKSYGVLEHFVVGEDGYENEFVNCEAHNIGVVGFSHTDGLVARFGAHDNRFIRCKSIGCTHGISVWTMEPNPNAQWITENVQRRNLFRNCLIVTEGTKGWHAAIVLDRACENRFENCTIVVNGIKGRYLFYLGKDGVTRNSTFRNCIIYGAHKFSYGNGAKPSFIYSCFWGNLFNAPSGEGNISADPLFADPKGGDFHLKSRAGRWDPKLKRWVKDDVTSPCIDGGDPRDDFSNEPQPNGGRINIGAYGNTEEASKSEYQRAGGMRMHQITEPILPKGKWRLIWGDEFDGAKLDESKWERFGPYKAFGGWIVPEAVSLDGRGHLVIKVFERNGEFFGGMVASQGKFEHRYGFWVARCKLPKEQGHFPAFWIWSSALTPGSPKSKVGGHECGTEIDVMEWWAISPNRVHHTLHWIQRGERRRSHGHSVDIPEIAKGFHFFGVEWTPDEYIFYVDGRETWRTNVAVSHVPEFACLSDHISEPGRWAGDIRKARLPDFFLVDFVRVYERVE